MQQYQSAEYDVIRFDEMTHFTESMYTYMISRVRGTRPFPRHVKSTANPGSVGHTNAKSRFIDIGAPMEVHRCKGGTRLFIPAKLEDNPFLLSKDPQYEERMKNRRAKSTLHCVRATGLLRRTYSPSSSGSCTLFVRSRFRHGGGGMLRSTTASTCWRRTGSRWMRTIMRWFTVRFTSLTLSSRRRPRGC